MSTKVFKDLPEELVDTIFSYLGITQNYSRKKCRSFTLANKKCKHKAKTNLNSTSCCLSQLCTTHGKILIANRSKINSPFSEIVSLFLLVCCKNRDQIWNSDTAGTCSKCGLLYVDTTSAKPVPRCTCNTRVLAFNTTKAKDVPKPTYRKTYVFGARNRTWNRTWGW